MGFLSDLFNDASDTQEYANLLNGLNQVADSIAMDSGQADEFVEKFVDEFVKENGGVTPEIRKAAEYLANEGGGMRMSTDPRRLDMPGTDISVAKAAYEILEAKYPENGSLEVSAAPQPEYNTTFSPV